MSWRRTITSSSLHGELRIGFVDEGCPRIAETTLGSDNFPNKTKREEAMSGGSGPPDMAGGPPAS